VACLRWRCSERVVGSVRPRAASALPRPRTRRDSTDSPLDRHRRKPPLPAPRAPPVSSSRRSPARESRPASQGRLRARPGFANTGQAVSRTRRGQGAPTRLTCCETVHAVRHQFDQPRPTSTGLSRHTTACATRPTPIATGRAGTRPASPTTTRAVTAASESGNRTSGRTGEHPALAKRSLHSKIKT
jgi:hypothetical protein